MLLRERRLASNKQRIGIVVPLYIYPGPQWKKLADTKRGHPSVPMIAVINPYNGPGNTRDSNYVAGVEVLRSAGIRILGYVSTNYGSRTKESVIADMETYSKWYHVDGMMFDEMSNKEGYEGYYLCLAEYARRIGSTTTIGNPGTGVPSSYFGSMNVLCIYENQGLPEISILKSRCNAGREKSEFAMISYRVDRCEPIYLSKLADYVNWVYITDADLPNPYNRLPSYLNSEVLGVGT